MELGGRGGGGGGGFQGDFFVSSCVAKKDFNVHVEGPSRHNQTVFNHAGYIGCVQCWYRLLKGLVS